MLIFKYCFWLYGGLLQILIRNHGCKHLLTHWGRVTHICVSKLTIIGSDNGLSPDRRQVIIWTDAGLLSIGPLRTYFSENLIKMQHLLLKKMHAKMCSAKWRPSCLGLNVLTNTYLNMNSSKQSKLLSTPRGSENPSPHRAFQLMLDSPWTQQVLPRACWWGWRQSWL